MPGWASTPAASRLALVEACQRPRDGIQLEHHGRGAPGSVHLCRARSSLPSIPMARILTAPWRSPVASCMERPRKRAAAVSPCITSLYRLVHRIFYLRAQALLHAPGPAPEMSHKRFLCRPWASAGLKPTVEGNRCNLKAFKPKVPGKPLLVAVAGWPVPLQVVYPGRPGLQWPKLTPQRRFGRLGPPAQREPRSMNGSRSPSRLPAPTATSAPSIRT